MLLKVMVFTDSYEDKVVITGVDTCEVYVRASAQNGHANKVTTALLAKRFETSVQMMTGGVRRNKVFQIKDKDVLLH